MQKDQATKNAISQRYDLFTFFDLKTSVLATVYKSPVPGHKQS